MNHRDVEQEAVVDRYLLGRLTAEEAELFEEHYLGCPECVEQLELGERLRRGLRRAVAQDVAEVAAARQVGWLVRLVRSPALSAVIVIVVVGLPALLVHKQIEHLGQELDATRSTVAELRQSGTSSQASVESLERDLASARSDLAAERRRFEQELATEKSSSRQLADRLARILQPQLNVPIFSLGRFRDAPLGAPASPQVVSLSAEPEQIVLSLDLDPPEDGTYRVTLLRQGEREVLRLDGLVPDPRGALVFGLHSSTLETGDYLARVEALPAAGEPVPAGRFSFRVVVRER